VLMGSETRISMFENGGPRPPLQTSMASGDSPQ
jgi:hypothetical protein